MKTIHALFSSALAIVAITMVALFITACDTQHRDGHQDQPAFEKTQVASISGTNVMLIEPLGPETLGPEALATEPETLTVVKSINNNISVLKAVTCASISENEPVGEGSLFKMSAGKVWLYTKIEMPKGESGAIHHVWKRDGEDVSTVELKVKGPTFRTHSYKTINAELRGSWTVDVTTGNGEVLETLSFTVE